jgi:hypothetical protein
MQRRSERLDRDTARRLLERLDPDDAPPGYTAVARVLRSATAISDDDEAASMSEFTLVRDRLLTASEPAVRSIPARRVPVGRAAKAGVGIVGAVLLLTSGVAAAGVLPTPMQTVAAAVLDRVGVHVPDDAADTTGDEGVSDRENDSSALDSSEHSDSSSPEASGEPSNGKGDDMSSLATTTDATGSDKGATISDEAAGEKSHAGDSKPDEHTPSSTVPSTPVPGDHGTPSEHRP